MHQVDQNVRDHTACRQDQNTNNEKTASHTKALTLGTLKHFGAVAEIIRNRLPESLLLSLDYFGSGPMNKDTKAGTR